MSCTRHLLTALILLTLTGSAWAARYEQYTRKFAQGPHMSVAGATFFGTDAVEEFVAAVHLDDGRVLAVGNTWGPSFPAQPAPTVLGDGRHSGKAVDADGEKIPYTDDTAGMLVWYTPDLSEVRQVVRLDWGVGRFGDAISTADGESVLIAGVAGPNIDSLDAATDLASGDAFIGLWTNDTFEWIKPVGAQGEIRRLFPREAGGAHLIVEHRGLQTLVEIDARGNARQLMQKKRAAKGGFLTVDPKDKNILFGGDRNTNTGREPWRQPFLYKYDRDGQKQWTLWEYPPKKLRDGESPGQGMVSDSSAFWATYAPNGDLLVIGWSDGGNSIFSRHPQDVSEPNPDQAMGFSLWGARVGSFAWIMRLDPETFDVKTWTNWAAYLPGNFMGGKLGDRPNGAGVSKATLLADGSLAITGGAATGLISTPNAFWQRPGDYEGKMGGEFVAVLPGDLSDVLFSSYLPGYDRHTTALSPSDAGVLITGRTRAAKQQDQYTIDAPTTDNAAQQQFGGGRDAHLIHLALPGESIGAATPRRGNTASARAGDSATPQAEGKSHLEKIAATRLNSARTYLQFDKTEPARRILQEIVDKYGDTPAAAEAAALLADL